MLHIVEALFHSIFTTTQWSWHYHFINEDTKSEKLSRIDTGGRLTLKSTSDLKVYILSNTMLYCKKVGPNTLFLKYFKFLKKYTFFLFEKTIPFPLLHIVTILMFYVNMKFYMKRWNLSWCPHSYSIGRQKRYMYS